MIITDAHIAIYRAAGACAEGLAEAELVREYGRLRPDCRMWIACNASTPAKVLARLATDKNQYVRRAVAEHPSTPAKALARMARDVNSCVRYRVVRHHATPADALARLATDADVVVRRAVAILHGVGDKQ